jgi:hypothetical protein
MICDYCGKPAELVNGLDVYPHRPDLKKLFMWRCAPCDARVGCHPGTKTPLGRLANRVLRRWKMRAHEAFDPIWQERRLSRREAYAWLAEQLGKTEAETHIGMFDSETCKRVIEVCRARWGTL